MRAQARHQRNGRKALNQDHDVAGNPLLKIQRSFHEHEKAERNGDDEGNVGLRLATASSADCALPAYSSRDPSVC